MSTSELPRFNKLVSTRKSATGTGSARRTAPTSPVWTAAAPAEVVEPGRAGDHSKLWAAWQQYLGRRESPFAGTPLDGQRSAESLRWGIADQEPNLSAAVEAIHNSNGDAAKAIPAAIAEIIAGPGSDLDESASLRLLACAYQLPDLASHLSDHDWWDLLGRLCKTALDAAALDVTAAPLIHQRLTGELPLALAVLFPEISACAELLPAARQALTAGIEELLDGEGTPHCRYLGVHHALMACWTRARGVGAVLDDGCWSDEAESQYHHAVCEMLRLARRDGQSVLSAAPIERRVPASVGRFFSAAVELAGDRANWALLGRFRGEGLPKAQGHASSKLPQPSNHSEWGQVAVLRPSWQRSAPQLAVGYGQPAMQAAISIGRDLLIAGEIGFTCLVDETEATAIGDWEDLCWVSDKDVDYLELQLELTGGLKIQRQFCLARKDKFLFIADAVLGGEAQSLRYSIRLPLHDGSIAPAGETREITLAARKSHAMLFPLALPEWRSDRRGGELSADGGVLALQQSAVGKALYAALWVDLDRDRQQKPFTWRQLAVAEERRNVARDAAAGYRVQFGKQQWIVYRSLTPARNRTFIGHNLSSEFLIARFHRDGSIKTLIEVE